MQQSKSEIALSDTWPEAREAQPRQDLDLEGRAPDDRYEVTVSAGWPYADMFYSFPNEKDARRFYESEYRNLESFPDGWGKVSLSLEGTLVASRIADSVTAGGASVGTA